MSTRLYQSATLDVTSYCGPANTDEHTRMRLQIGAPAGLELVTLGYSDVVVLARVLAAWIEEHAK